MKDVGGMEGFQTPKSLFSNRLISMLTSDLVSDLVRT